MPSIVNGLFSARAGIQSFGNGIAVEGDNISNSGTIGFKTTRAEFQDLIAGGQTAGKVVGSGSDISAVTTIFAQGTLEFTSRPLDLAIDGNGLFVLADGAERFYSRAGNFRINSSGYIVNQNGLSVLGFPADGTGSLEPINVNTVSQDSVATGNITITGNVDATATTTTIAAIDALGVGVAGVGTSNTTYSEINELAAFSTTVSIFDSLGEKHDVNFYFFNLGTNSYQVRGYVNNEEVDTNPTTSGLPRQITTNANVATLTFGGDGARSPTPTAGVPDMNNVTINWTNNGADNSVVDITLAPFTQFAAAANINSISQDGEGIGTVTSVSIAKSGVITALLDNGQSASIGTLGLVNFANPEGLVRVGKNLLQQSTDSGEPVVGRPDAGTFGKIEAGSLELSNVDIATSFTKVITLQRGFQANSRFVSIINQLLNEIIQLV